MAHINPNLFCRNGPWQYLKLTNKLPSQKFDPPKIKELRPEKWKSKKWVRRLSAKDPGLTKEEKYECLKDLCRDSCWIFCCPPCSATAVANKVAFSAPRKPAYWPVNPPESTCSPANPCPVTTKDYVGGVRIFWVTTSKGHRIACTFIASPVASAPVILYSHSNAEDLGTAARHLRNMSRTLFCNVFAYDYSGYGLSEKQSSVANLYADAEAAYLALRFYYRFNPDEIILYGSSLGSVTTSHLASRFSCRGVILVASVPSGIRILCRGTTIELKEKVPFDVLDNISTAEKIQQPVLVVHGEQDTLCPIEGAIKLLQKLPYPVEPAIFKDAGHSESELFKRACMRMSYFIHAEATQTWSKIYAAGDNKPQSKGVVAHSDSKNVSISVPSSS